MRKFLLYTLHFTLYTFLIGCATGKVAIKPTPGAELVEAEGQAPIIKDDLVGAKNTALSEAQRSALGMVVGVYVSGETLVSKATLLEENILGQTQGYIEKYAVIKEWREGDFYKTRIKAAVRKEDLAKKINEMNLEPKPAPFVAFWIDEKIEDKPVEVSIVESQLMQNFLSAGFRISDEKPRKIFNDQQEAEKTTEKVNADILILGNAVSRFVTDKDLGGMISYRATLSVKAIKPNTREVVSAVDDVSGGVDITNEAAAKASLKRVAEKFGTNFAKNLYETLQKQTTVILKISGIPDLNQLNNLNRIVRSFIEVKDSRVRNYSGDLAMVEMTLRRGNAQDIARRLEQLKDQKISIISVGQYDLEAILSPTR
ncbi:MAG TPA: hypothetical protein DHV62_08850 [Elusimicrobia bacterium]|nr:hypothetical protein [Elusimicrobiota bacterium]